jgi:peptidoglycan hydrolase-like protein with peptidoglycan-binding domain
VLFFFSVGCGGCGPSTQALAQVQQAVGTKANFVAVDVGPGETEQDIKAFLTANRPPASPTPATPMIARSTARLAAQHPDPDPGLRLS